MENREIINNLRHIRNWKCNGDSDMYATITAAISALEQQEKDRWIPEEERLPEKDGNYLVTLYDSTERWTEVLYWNSTFGGRWQGLIEDDLSDIGNVSAWRPLPEPYQEDDA